ncbi:hypothetical protein K0M31_015869 [Melipona bicolor]|uniref:Uncharacterized protein n=1 Tax=Melipona bicolor TaxID=60889 RepID=A0AA40G6B9_9HYME|nr:hypothetical protein K0M31_015869 [Melipona bicolor]
MVSGSNSVSARTSASGVNAVESDKKIEIARASLGQTSRTGLTGGYASGMGPFFVARAKELFLTSQVDYT